MVEQNEFNAQLSEKIHTEENSLDQRFDGLNNDFEHEWDNLQDSIESLINQQQCPPEEECLSDTMVEKHSEQQLQEEMIEDFVEVVQGLSESSNIGVTFWPWKQEEQISALITEEGSGIEAGKEPQKNVLQPIPTELNPTATAQATKNPLPVAPSDDKVYILPTPVAKSTHAAPAPNHKSNPSLHVMQKFKKLVANVQAFATTSKTQQLPTLHGTAVGSGAGSDLEHPNLVISKLPPLFVLIFLALFYFMVFYFDFFNFSL